MLTVGAGNSGCDLAVDAANARLESTISIRRGQMFQPKAVFGVPRAEIEVDGEAAGARSTSGSRARCRTW